MKATIIASIDHPDEVRAAEAWLDRRCEQLTFVSEDKGCGCCTHMWDVEGPATVLDSIPAEIRAWARPDD